MTASNSFSEGIKQAARSAACFVLGQAELANSWAAKITPPSLGGPFDSVVPLRRWLCSNPDPNPVPPPLFFGGQCDGARYEVNITVRRPDNNEIAFVGRFRTRGPIGGFRVGSDGRVRGFSRGNWNNPNDGYPAPSTYEERLVSFAVFFNSSVIHEVWFTETPDGDDCGDLPPVVDDYDPQPVSRSITYITNEGDTITELGDFVLLAPVIIGGNVIAPVTVNIGGIKIPLRINFSTGDINFESGDGFPDTPIPTVEEEPVENPGIEDEIPTVESLIYGVVVYSSPVTTGRDKTTLVAQLGAPSLRLPRTGNVWFQIPFGERSTWLGPYPVQSRNQLVMVPDGLGAVDVKLVASSGWSLQGVPLAKPSCGCSAA